MSWVYNTKGFGSEDRKNFVLVGRSWRSRFTGPVPICPPNKRGRKDALLVTINKVTSHLVHSLSHPQHSLQLIPMPLLNRPVHSKETLGDRSFSFASSSVWNSIPNDIRCAPSLSSSKSRLKTYLFRSVYKD